ncbi:MAG: acyl-CoA thioesterase [Burkholderiales bacterium]|nr:acyl-CoA thioesterase [Burkholderiales bacterium]
MIFKKNIEVRWSDIDANGHLNHTIYGEFCTNTRIAWMESIDYSIKNLLNMGLAAVLLKEQTEYFCEIFLGETVTVELYFAGISPDKSRWKFAHKIFNSKGKLSAINIVYGAWIEIKNRKIAAAPLAVVKKLEDLTKYEGFEMLVNLIDK